jgi:hypothetical protein
MSSPDSTETTPEAISVGRHDGQYDPEDHSRHMTETTETFDPLKWLRAMEIGTGEEPFQLAADELERLRDDCAGAYQVVGVLAEMAGVFNDPQVIKALDNLSAASNGDPRPHADVLPFGPSRRP